MFKKFFRTRRSCPGPARAAPAVSTGADLHTQLVTSVPPADSAPSNSGLTGCLLQKPLETKGKPGLRSLSDDPAPPCCPVLLHTALPAGGGGDLGGTGVIGRQGRCGDQEQPMPASGCTGRGPVWVQASCSAQRRAVTSLGTSPASCRRCPSWGIKRARWQGLAGSRPPEQEAGAVLGEGWPAGTT